MCDTDWHLERLECRAQRAAVHARLATPVADLYQRMAVIPIRAECQRLAGRFLLRHAQRDNRRLLRGFAPEVDQRVGIVRFEEPLDRLLACVSPPERRQVVDKVHALVASFVALPTSSGSPSQAVRHPPEFWGVSPWRPLPPVTDFDPG